MNTKTRAPRKPEPQADLHPTGQMKPTPRPLHTPLPWAIGGRANLIEGADGSYVINSDGFTPEDAAFIVRAVNAHDDLLEACKAFVRPHYTSNKKIERCQAAILKAEGR